jgi:hypothetical protein
MRKLCSIPDCSQGKFQFHFILTFQLQGDENRSEARKVAARAAIAVLDKEGKGSFTLDTLAQAFNPQFLPHV